MGSEKFKFWPISSISALRFENSSNLAVMRYMSENIRTKKPVLRVTSELNEIVQYIKTYTAPRRRAFCVYSGAGRTVSSVRLQLCQIHSTTLPVGNTTLTAVFHPQLVSHSFHLPFHYLFQTYFTLLRLRSTAIWLYQFLSDSPPTYCI
jgi:hypothetical protein